MLTNLLNNYENGRWIPPKFSKELIEWYSQFDSLYDVYTAKEIKEGLVCCRATCSDPGVYWALFSPQAVCRKHIQDYRISQLRADWVFHIYWFTLWLLGEENLLPKEWILETTGS